ncbi:MAG: DUF2147 domain-containing protein [Flavobacteriales bacterium]|nr:DUF2147 domain-containing protein [Flavobacteriales bacterium]
MKKLLQFITLILLFSTISTGLLARTLYNSSYKISKLIVSHAEDRFAADDIVGYWMHEENVVKIKIERIGNKYYGKMVWLEKPNFADGTPKKDIHNPDPALRDTPFIGLRIVKDLEYKGNGTWGGGTLYDPEHGKTYGCKITLVSENEADVRGYIGFAFIGKSVRFNRVAF